MKKLLVIAVIVSFLISCNDSPCPSGANCDEIKRSLNADVKAKAAKKVKL
jgi:hypothetical protein